MVTGNEDQKSMSITVQDQKSITTSEQSLSDGVLDQKRKFAWHGLRFIARVYGSSLVLTSVYFPIIASSTTVCFYLAPQITFPLLPIHSQWYAPVYGFISACIICLIFAALRFHFATASGANKHIYEELVNRHADLEARLNSTDINEMKGAAISTPNAKIDQITLYKMKALNVAYNTYQKLHNKLFQNNSSIEWILGTGYVNAWHLVHRTQEALVGIETTQEVVGEVVHDIRAIQKSAISDSKDLIRKMLQAVKSLCPEAMAYFDELRADKYYVDLFPPHSNIDLADSTPTEELQQQSNQLEELAREAIRQVKHALNVYQDSLRHTLIRSRNYTYIAIALTAFITYFLLCFVILWNTNQVAIGSVTAYYMIGVITGLFVQFYNETKNKNDDAPPDDYGLFTSRLLATPVLSGLAAIGGVLVTATLPALSGQHVLNAPELGTIFNGTVTLEYLFAAALFGYSPNLIIGNLQQRTRKYSTDLQNSRGEVSGKDE
jgi:hypothetical protein